MCKFQITEDWTNAHAGMPFLRYISVCRISPKGWFLATALLGRGSFVFIGY